MRTIMFNDRYGLTAAVLSGRKTQTRRKSCRYKVGEVVAIAQSYKDLGYNPQSPNISPKDWRIVRGTLGQSKGWNNKMFVRADACKHHIRIIAMRQERLQDISDEDCLKEGIEKWLSVNKYVYKDIKKERMIIFNTPREAYAVLIDRLNGKGTWASNPYVFVYDFELVD